MVTPQSIQRHTGLTHHFLIFDRAQMSKIKKNGGLDQYGPEQFGRLILSQLEKCGTERVKTLKHTHRLKAVPCLVTLRPLCKIFLAAPGADPEFLVSNTGQIFKKIFWLRIVHFGLVWPRYMIRLFRIHLNILEKFLCPLAAPCKVCGPPAIAGAAGLTHDTDWKTFTDINIEIVVVVV